jgi:hypothetical protein
MQVVGKRHFGLKALPQGGGGGRQITRELFDTLLVWKARVPLNEKGEATVDIPLNDSLTSFRIVAWLPEGSDYLVLGDEHQNHTGCNDSVRNSSPLGRTICSLQALRYGTLPAAV